LSLCPACACPHQPSTVRPAGTGHRVSVLQAAKPQAWALLRACPACSARRHQPGGATYFWGDTFLPLPHARDGSCGPHWSRPVGGLPTLASAMGLPQCRARGSRLGPLRGPALLPRGQSPGSCSTLTLPDVPRKLLSVVGLATGDSQLLGAEIPHGHDVDGAIFCTITPVCSG